MLNLIGIVIGAIVLAVFAAFLLVSHADFAIVKRLDVVAFAQLFLVGVLTISLPLVITKRLDDKKDEKDFLLGECSELETLAKLINDSIFENKATGFCQVKFGVLNSKFRRCRQICANYRGHKSLVSTKELSREIDAVHDAINKYWRYVTGVDGIKSDEQPIALSFLRRQEIRYQKVLGTLRQLRVKLIRL